MDMTKLRVAFRNFANAHKNQFFTFPTHHTTCRARTYFPSHGGRRVLFSKPVGISGLTVLTDGNRHPRTGFILQFATHVQIRRKNNLGLNDGWEVLPPLTQQKYAFCPQIALVCLLQI
jgi:hypothetical protein